MPGPVITLTTDFGLVDSYVAQMNGIVADINPAAHIVDVTHQIPPQDVFRGAKVLDEIVDHFSAGTIHVAVVDPGVGSDRRIIAVNAGEQFFVLPDNGLIQLIARRKSINELVVVTEAKFFRESAKAAVSNTFHGRDIMSPVAAHLSLGVLLSEFGPAIAEDSLCELQVPVPKVSENELVGEIVWVDSFGNLITNIDASQIPEEWRSNMSLSVGTLTLSQICDTYSDVEPGEFLALVNSSNQLEFAVNGGRADVAIGTDLRSAEVRVKCVFK